MRILLTAITPSLVEAWGIFFKNAPGVEILTSDITQLTVDALVSPANSFGFMDGSLDYAISERLGWDLEKKLQAKIKALPTGELLVGQAIILETGDSKIPHLISAPTMRIPTNFNINTSINAYLAMKAILIAAQNDDRIHSVAIPGLCTGVGRMDPKIAASQMFAAYEEIMLGKHLNFDNFADAQRHHRLLNPLGMIWTH
ncbi:O-acetyl-ADP-ribose deacetylase (regulator of RNase III) [Chitinophaga skermanii]|uniref:O-acetyl-ADP-ribose deacetylase (Regulator of RNase III) n=1 Tax=Chitinophaga skermanii TaxID=331697 RepID=A0A327R6G5_9BACT|nr:macro domain-containing protein [Chitinophaga skermanii]RAJ11173.1 O-acetyl-ADP-ribose deacetylase (regulator of RNase III) [Chitinophaga skermanii]